MKNIIIKINFGPDESKFKFCSKAVYLASCYESDVTVYDDNAAIDMKSILGLTTLLFYQDKEIKVTISGKDENECAEALLFGLQ